MKKGCVSQEQSIGCSADAQNDISSEQAHRHLIGVSVETGFDPPGSAGSACIADHRKPMEQQLISSLLMGLSVAGITGVGPSERQKLG
jgi:hypothetical protein